MFLWSNPLKVNPVVILISVFLGIFWMGAGLNSGYAQVTPDLLLKLDLNGNAKIDPPDLFLFLNYWKTNDSRADFTSDGLVDETDLLLVVELFHSTIEIPPTPTATPTIAEATPTATATPTIVEATPTATATPTIVEATPTATATPTIVEATPTATATPTIVEATPTATATPTIVEATPTATPTPTIVVATPTPTATPTITEATPTPTTTPTIAEATPTSTPTLPVVVATSTPTPTVTPVPETPTPTSTIGPSPSPTPTIDQSSTPTPTPAGLFFYTNFDLVDSLQAAGLKTLDATSEVELIQENRMPDTNRLLPWFIVDTTQLDPILDLGVALSDPKSAGLNGSVVGFYDFSQTSVLEINLPLNTAQAGNPILSFDAAFLTEIPFSRITDFMVVEVKPSNSDQWQMADINGDGQIIDDKTAFDANNPQALLPNSFDGLFGASNPNNPNGPLTKDDFVHIEVKLPADTALRIAFRFESDTTGQNEGVFLDNIRVFDASTGSGANPIILKVLNQDGAEYYVDSETRVLIQGNRTDPVDKVLFKSRDGETALPFNQTADGITATLPRLSNPSQAETAVLTIVRKDGASSDPFLLKIQAAPAPRIDTISPSPFYLNAADSIIHILGSHFRPAFPGATESNGSSVTIDTGTGNPIKYQLPQQFLQRTENEIVIDGSQLRSLGAGPVTIFVKNEYSGLESNAVNLVLQTGAGEVLVTGFQIEVGLGAYSYDPAQEQYPLQQDQAFTLIWDAPGLSADPLNINLAGIPFVINGAINNTVIQERLQEMGRAGEDPNGKANLFVNFAGATLELSPMILGATGTITASLRIGNGAPAENTFALLDPQPPILYERDDDWSHSQYSASQTIYPFTVYGDNFRGLSTFGAQGEQITRLILLPVDGSAPIELPRITSAFDYTIQPTIGDDPFNEDVLFQEIPANTISVLSGQTREFRLRLLNPDSGLMVESATRTVTFTP